MAQRSGVQALLGDERARLYGAVLAQACDRLAHGPVAVLRSARLCITEVAAGTETRRAHRRLLWLAAENADRSTTAPSCYAARISSCPRRACFGPCSAQCARARAPAARARTWTICEGESGHGAQMGVSVCRERLCDMACSLSITQCSASASPEPSARIGLHQKLRSCSLSSSSTLSQIRDSPSARGRRS
jgi:hypothetical protein